MKFSLRRSEVMVIVILAASFLAAFVFYPILPAQVPSHWNAAGKIDGYLSPVWGAFLMPLVGVVFLLLFIVVPRIDPKRENIEKFRSHFDEFILVLFTFLAYLHLFILFIALDYDLRLTPLLSVGVALVFGAAARLIAHAEPNWSAGIRTPWTLSSDAVWRQTHVLGSTLFNAAALLALVGLAFPSVAVWLVVLPAAAAVVGSVIASYVFYRREKEGQTKAVPR